MPSKERLRGDEERRPPTPRKDPVDRGHEQAVAAAKTRSANLALEDHQLMAKDHQLDLGARLAGRASDRPDDTAQQQIDESKEHERNLPEEEGGPIDPTNAPVESENQMVCGPFRVSGMLEPLRTCVVGTRIDS